MVLAVRIIMSPISSSRFLVGRYALSATLRTISSYLSSGGIDGLGNSTPCHRRAPPPTGPRARCLPGSAPPPIGHRRWYGGAIVRARRRAVRGIAHRAGGGGPRGAAALAVAFAASALL